MNKRNIQIAVLLILMGAAGARAGEAGPGLPDLFDGARNRRPRSSIGGDFVAGGLVSATALGAGVTGTALFMKYRAEIVIPREIKTVKRHYAVQLADMTVRHNPAAASLLMHEEAAKTSTLKAAQGVCAQEMKWLMRNMVPLAAKTFWKGGLVSVMAAQTAWVNEGMLAPAGQFAAGTVTGSILGVALEGLSVARSGGSWPPRLFAPRLAALAGAAAISAAYAAF